ncbi:MAG: hypothetical protein Q9173_005718 [Seirophora scorigena]
MAIFAQYQRFGLLLCCLAICTHQASAATVTFANLRSPDAPTFQVCKTGRDPDVCCEPLDIDANDGRGYGWFRADTVAFSYIGAPDIVTTVYGHRATHPCALDVIATRQGNRDWNVDIPGATGSAGSAAVLKHPDPRGPAPERKLPATIVIGDVRYDYWFEGPKDIYTYLDDDGNVVAGRPLVRPQPRPSSGPRPVAEQ